MQLIVIVLLCLLFGDIVPETSKSLLLAISLFIKAILIFILPIIVFSLVFYAFANLAGNMFSFSVFILSLICLSNFLGVMFSYAVGLKFQEFISVESITSYENNIICLMPYFSCNLPKFCDNSIGLIIGLSLGIYTKATNSLKLKLMADKFAEITNKFLQKLFIPIIPLFITGFMLKLQHDGALNILLRNFSSLLLVVVSLQVTYLSSIYFICNNLNLTKTIASIKNIIPACIIGFSTMSSAAAMPVLTTGAMKNAVNPKLVQSIIPSVINTHMLGDALGIPLMAISLYLMQYHQVPEFSMYLGFALGYVVAKFSAAGIPGGTIIIMIPVLESNMLFTSEMSAAILMMYILFDPFCTMSNIFGNGLFAKVFEKLWYFNSITKSQLLD